MFNQKNLISSKAVLLATLFSLSLTNSAFAAELELALSSDTGAAELNFDSSSVGSGGADLRLGLLFNEADDVMANAGLIVRGAAVAQRPFVFGLGAGIYYGNTDIPDANFGALALGFGMKYIIPGNTPVGLGGDVFFAPDVTSFSDADGLVDFRLRAEIDVLPSATAFIGYRKVTVELNNNIDRDIDDNIHLGIRLQF